MDWTFRLGSAKGFWIIYGQATTSSFLLMGHSCQRDGGSGITPGLFHLGAAIALGVDSIPSWIEGCGKEILNSKWNINRTVISCNIYTIKKQEAWQELFSCVFKEKQVCRVRGGGGWGCFSGVPIVWGTNVAAQGHRAGGAGRNKSTGQKKRKEGFEEKKKERMMRLLSCSSGILQQREDFHWRQAEP